MTVRLSITTCLHIDCFMTVRLSITTCLHIDCFMTVRLSITTCVILNLTVITLLSRSFVLVLENQPFRTHSIQRITCSGWMILEFISLV
jgi:hypothetical protein